MAQYYFDFRNVAGGLNTSDGRIARIPGIGYLYPALSSNFHQEISRAPGGGLDMWLRNSPGGTGNFTTTAMLYLEDVLATDCEVVMEYIGMQYNGGAFNNDGLAVYSRLSALSGDPDRYELGNAGSFSDATSSSRKRVSAVTTGLVSSGGGGRTKNTRGWTRWQTSGINIRCRSWETTGAEPGTWGHATTDSDLTDAGYISFGFTGAIGGGTGNPYGLSAGTRYRIFRLGIGTDGDPAPTSLPGGNREVSGIVRMPNSSPAVGYEVRLHSQETGVVMDWMLTDGGGEFSFLVASDRPVYAVAIDQLGNAWRAPIVDRVTPAAPE